MESDHAIMLYYEDKLTDLAAECERIIWRTFDMNMVTFTEMNHARRLIVCSPSSKIRSVDDDGREWDEDELTGPSHRRL